MREIFNSELKEISGGDRWCEESQPTITPEQAELLAGCIQGMTQFGPNWDCLLYLVSR